MIIENKRIVKCKGKVVGELIGFFPSTIFDRKGKPYYQGIVALVETPTGGVLSFNHSNVTLVREVLEEKTSKG